ncbi:MAG TPA: nitroreductase family deazaflavin-dependent oxidoreductase [Gaiellales bacterium]|nr:nitroreductase family deazaflavin-dependent oxidoreductase [Gaiellales bacterium]
MLIRLGVAPGGAALLTVRGRRTGRPRSTPVNPVAYAGETWLVAPYGAVGWVRNVRASGDVALSRGRHVQSYRAVEVTDEQAAPVLRLYLGRIRVARPYFDVTRESSLEAFAAEANRHPVFHLEPTEPA